MYVYILYCNAVSDCWILYGTKSDTLGPRAIRGVLDTKGLFGDPGCGTMVFRGSMYMI